MNEEPRKFKPLPGFFAMREALAKLPPASLESVMLQAKASEEWRKRQPEGKKTGSPGES